MGIIVGFVVLVVVVTIVLSRVIRNAAITVVVSVTASVIGFQLLSYINLGYLDPFFFIAVAIQGVIGLVASIATIVVSRLAKKSRERHLSGKN